MEEIIPRMPGQNPLLETRAEAELKVNKKEKISSVFPYFIIL